MPVEGAAIIPLYDGCPGIVQGNPSFFDEKSESSVYSVNMDYWDIMTLVGLRG